MGPENKLDLDKIGDYFENHNKIIPNFSMRLGKLGKMKSTFSAEMKVCEEPLIDPDEKHIKRSKETSSEISDFSTNNDNEFDSLI